MKHFLIWIFLFFFAMSGFAQDLNIKGQITDTSGESIIGVNVKVKGKDTGRYRWQLSSSSCSE